MFFDLIIKNGIVILENEVCVVDIVVKGGKIVVIGQDLGDVKEVMDVFGLVVLLGMVDVYIYIFELGCSYWEGYEIGICAAVKGGIIIMIEMLFNQLFVMVDCVLIELKFDVVKGKLIIDVV